MLTLNVKEARSGVDALTGKEGDGVLLSLPDGRERFFIWKSLRQFISMELATPVKPRPGNDSNTTSRNDSGNGAAVAPQKV